MTKTLEELALTEISSLPEGSTSVFAPGDTVSKVLGVLKDTGRTEAVAAEGDRYGIVAVRDLLGVDQPERTKIENIWNQVGYVTSSTSVLEATDLILGNGVSAVPLVDGKDVHMVSQQDILDALADVEELKNTSAKTIMTTPVLTMDAESPISQIRRTMMDKNYSFIPVTKEGKLVGMITAEEIVHTFVTTSSKTTRGDRSGQKVTRFPGKANGMMNRQPFTILTTASVMDVIKGLISSGEKACVVVDEGSNVHGIITEMELLKLIHALMPTAELPVYIVGIEDENFFERSVVEDKIRRVVKRSSRMHTITEVSVRIKKQQTSGERIRYKITARAMGPKDSYNVENEDWGLMETFDGLTDQLSKTMRRAKAPHQKGRRRGRRRPNPNLKP
ncbi:CBS domain-containing protein [Candidatus Bathyarchaeota archaeon]|nr:CBS domain-containing protein [Candidatus Bathyarchaeota archaeon]MBT4319935.1 CBS domain-containing protein [Candidatus Bathyarchaeota archaeon]MBT4422805.1 CBS domain-containing protein [Candidatus Bathyarchaeota archaeon]MBT5642037.1 CBS domain-containing protein [Candidatus Bathyarchaeota archaeon]MBT6603782.1 CBS domain-containing protein [Candidatus Bathyarchaeota archaeon]